jgi:hypothetical protein
MKVITCSATSDPVRQLVDLAGCLGIIADLIEIRSAADFDSALSTAAPGDGLVVDVASIATALPDSAKQLRNALSSADLHALLLTTRASDAVSRYLAVTTADVVSAANHLDASDAASCAFAGAPAQELAGHVFPRSGEPALCLRADDDTFESILTIGGRPSFGRLTKSINRSTVFVWSTRNVFDMFALLDAELELELALDEFIPGIIFLRSAFGDRCWHNPSPVAALVVDDPLLRRHYGFIDFEELLNSARAHQYHVTLAFIPWNHRRTKIRDAAFFRRYSDVFSVCVHGNDHTNDEFFSENSQDLLSRVTEALVRMEAHTRRTGLPYESVMVFPQERYSVKALQALGESRGFTAVTNTRRIPDDEAAQGSVCGAELLLPASDWWFGVPILKRHYSHEGMGKFALALFLGQPAVLAEHHQYFESGTDRIERFVADLRRINPEVHWRPLSDTLRRLCWRRRISATRWGVLFFADSFELEHAFEEATVYEFARRIPEGADVESVTVNGDQVEFVARDGRLQFDVLAASPGPYQVVVSLGSTDVKPTARRTVSSSYRAQVALQRLLREARDLWSSSNLVPFTPIWSMLRTVCQTLKSIAKQQLAE